jgi:hypothetical protein
MQRIILAFICILVVSSPASAKRHSSHFRHHQQIQFTQTLSLGSAEGEHVISRRPSGCPHRFCGCEASIYKFGKIIADLNLASNWIRRFPRTMAAPGMAAARSGHVMILMSHVSGSDWLVHDGNSGGGLTREHVRSIRGYVIVDPNGNNVAATSKSGLHQRTAQLPSYNY